MRSERSVSTIFLRTFSRTTMSTSRLSSLSSVRGTEREKSRHAESKRLMLVGISLVMEEWSEAFETCEKSYETLLTFYGSGFVIVEKLAAVEASLTLTQKLHSLRTELEHDPLAQELFPGPYRRPRIGKPTATWRKLLRSELNRVGVPDEFEESLLISTGLLPYRPLPSVVD
jgi:hypothetical protein